MAKTGEVFFLEDDAVMQQALKIIRQYYPDTQAVLLFGTYGTAYQTEKSDVDLALLLPHDTAVEAGTIAASDCMFALADYFSRDVDLINLRVVDTVFQMQIIETGNVVFCRDATAFDTFAMYVLSLYQILQEERAGILEDVRKSGRILQP